MYRQTSAGTQNVLGTSETRSGANLSEFDGGKDTGAKSGSESLLDSVEKFVHKRGEGEHSRAISTCSLCTMTGLFGYLGSQLTHTPSSSLQLALPNPPNLRAGIVLLRPHARVGRNALLPVLDK